MPSPRPPDADGFDHAAEPYRSAVVSGLMHTLSEVAAHSESLDEAVQLCIDGICRLTGWPVGHAYFPVEPGAKALRPSDIWHLADQDEYQAFVEITRKTFFDPGIGLPGRVMVSGEPVWVQDVHAEPNFPRGRLATTIGVKGSFGAPVKVHREIVAVLEFFSNETLDPQEELIGIVRDIVAHLGRVLERVRTKQQLERNTDLLARRNEELEQLAYVASHDLQEPLRKITSFCSLLAKEYADQLEGDGQVYMDHVVEGVQRMRSLVRDLQAYTRLGIGPGEFAKVDVGEAYVKALCNLGRLLEESEAIVTHDPWPIVKTDKAQLTQLLQNLIGNAIQYRSDAEPRVHVGVREGDQHWVFSVRDNGIGIDSRYHTKIFGLFERLHAKSDYEGTGIGLAMCRRISEHLGGTIWVESELGQGSVFSFTVPRSAEFCQPPTPLRLVH